MIIKNGRSAAELFHFEKWTKPKARKKINEKIGSCAVCTPSAVRRHSPIEFAASEDKRSTGSPEST